ncbi:hypothetical protein D3C86_1665430 [compost metagenome]
MNSLTAVELSWLPLPNASPSKAPPTVAFPTSEEKEAPKSPTRKKVEAALPNKGSNALAMSDALFTLMPLVFNTAAAQTITIALIMPRITIPVILWLFFSLISGLTFIRSCTR